jgi:glucose uptake protein
MVVINSYAVAVALCFLGMLAWGSWPNTLKLVKKEWKFQLFYWDYAVGVLLFALIVALTLGSNGSAGRSFADDLRQATPAALGLAFFGGVIFNCYNLLLVSGVDIAGIAVAFPVGVGLASALGTTVNYLSKPKGDPLLVFGGVAAIVLAVVLCALAYKRMPSQGQKTSTKGILVSLAAGIFGAFFFLLVASSMAEMGGDGSLTAGKLSPYTAVVMFGVGLVVSNFPLNSLLMMKPFSGEPVPFGDYFSKGDLKQHAIGILGGLIWCVGMSTSILASKAAGQAVSYALVQSCTVVAAVWGVFVWKEFAAAPVGTYKLIAAMFLAYFVGIVLLTMAV